MADRKLYKGPTLKRSMVGSPDHEESTRVRDYQSRAEVQIARLLEREGMAYSYEHPLAVVDRGRTRIWYPDFNLPEYGMIIEYFGLNGDAGYRERTRHKMQVYKQEGIGGVFLTPASLKGDWPARITDQVEQVLEDRLKRFRSRR